MDKTRHPGDDKQSSTTLNARRSIKVLRHWQIGGYDYTEVYSEMSPEKKSQAERLPTLISISRTGSTES